MDEPEEIVGPRTERPERTELESSDTDIDNALEFLSSRDLPPKSRPENQDTQSNGNSDHQASTSRESSVSTADHRNYIRRTAKSSRNTSRGVESPKGDLLSGRRDTAQTVTLKRQRSKAGTSNQKMGASDPKTEKVAESAQIASNKRLKIHEASDIELFKRKNISPLSRSRLRR